MIFHDSYLDNSDATDLPLESSFQDEEEGQGNSSNSLSLNSTAYRIFRILEWLQESPLSIEELNQKFVQEPLIGKKLSSDTLWLYINTLRLLGCEISRPSPSNGFRHELLQHPFGIPVSKGDVEMIQEVKLSVEDHFTYQEMILVDRFFQRILKRSFLVGSEPGEVFNLNTEGDSRAVSFPEHQELEKIQEMIRRSQLMKIQYDSPVQGLETFYFLPEQIILRRGVFYLNGYQQGRPDLTMLRFDRVKDFEAVEDRQDLYQEVSQVQNRAPQVVIRLYGVTPEDYIPFGMEDEYLFLSSSSVDAQYMDISLNTKDFFHLKQKLLESGYMFDVIAPLEFKTIMLRTLTLMKGVYQGTTP